MKKRPILIGIFLLVVASIIFIKFKSFKDNKDTLSEDDGNVSITKEQMLEDFNFMITEIEENSPFWGAMERRNFTSTWERLKLQYRDEIKTEDFNVMQFYNKLQRFLTNFPVGHLDVMTANMYQIHYDFILKSPYGEGYNDAWKEAITNEKTFNFYSKLDSRIGNNLDDDSLDSDKNNMPNDNYSPYETKIIEEGKTALLQIDSFLYPPNEERMQELFEFYRSISNYENLIIDITKNKGGNTTYWSEAVVWPNLKEDVNYSYYVLYRDTPLIRKFYYDQIEKYEIDKEEVKPLFIHENADDYDDLDIAIEIKETWSPYLDEPLFKGKIWVLTSKNNLSASERFVSFCKSTGFATTIGGRTGGDSSGGTSLYFSLPNSGIMVRFDAGYMLNDDGTSKFETGTEPDINVKGNALEECLRIIDNGEDQ